jgi:prolyl-tRNA synthetase
MGDEKPVLAVVRGDDDLDEAKLQTATGAAQVRPARPEEIRPMLGADAGSLGAVGIRNVPVLVDESLAGAAGMVTGANENDCHLEGVEVKRDLSAGRLVDLRKVKVGEGCPRCDGALDLFKALEVGHIFKLGTKYSVSMKSSVLLADGKESPVVMGSYGIGVERVMAAAVELHHDADGIIWPFSIAPFHATVLTMGKEPELAQAAEEAVAALGRAGMEVLLDDRDERAGVKFKDADLIGIPLRIAVGKRGLAEGKIEWKLRRGKQVDLVLLGDVEAHARALLAAEVR